MKNNIDQILRDKIGDMSSAPPAGLWSKIEHGLNAGGAEAFDQVVKEKLAGMSQKPPAGLWAKIGSAVNAVPFYKTAVFRWVAAASVAIVSIAGWYMLNNESQPAAISDGGNVPNENITVVKKQMETKIPAKTTEIEKITDDINKLVVIESEKNTASEIVKISSGNKIAIANSLVKNEKTAEVNFDESVNTSVNEKQIDNYIIEKPIDVAQSKVENPVIAANDNHNTGESAEGVTSVNNQNNQNTAEKPVVTNNSESITSQNAANQDVVVQDVEEGKKIKPETIEPGRLPRNPRNLNKYGIEFSYSPTSINTSVNTVGMHDVNLSFAYRNMNFIADVGIGVGFSSENTEYEMNYKRNEFVKMQFVTDSLSYTYDTVSQSFVPVPYGHREKVYDDVKYSYNSEATTSYTYFNVPLNFGYQKDFGRFSFIAKVGLKYAVIISKTVKGIMELDDHSTLTNFRYPVRTRYSSSISYMLSFGGAMKITDDISLTGEVLGSYYQNPFYKEADMRSRAFGVRAGLIYYLN